MKSILVAIHAGLTKTGFRCKMAIAGLGHGEEPIGHQCPGTEIIFGPTAPSPGRGARTNPSGQNMNKMTLLGTQYMSYQSRSWRLFLGMTQREGIPWSGKLNLHNVFVRFASRQDRTRGWKSLSWRSRRMESDWVENPFR